MAGRTLEQQAKNAEFRARVAKAKAETAQMKAAEVAAKKFSESYKAASLNRTTADWRGTFNSADADIIPNLPELRERSRDLSRNNPFAASIISTDVSNVIGKGLRPQSAPDFERIGISREEAKAFSDTVERLWETEFVPFADMANRLSFSEIQAMTRNNYTINGEALLLPMVVSSGGSGKPILKVMSVESDRLESPTALPERDGRDIAGGIEVDKKTGAPRTYWILKNHPGDTFSVTTNPEDFTQVRAFDSEGRPKILHYYRQTRPGQRRGVPMLTPAMQTLQMLNEYFEAEQIAARANACTMAFVKNGGANAFPTQQTTNSFGQNLGYFEPGMLLSVGDSDMQFFDPSRPGSQFAPFIEANMRAVGAAVGMPLELVMKDFSKGNYSNTKAGMMEARRMFKMEQQAFVHRVLQPIWDLFVEVQFLRGELPIDNFYDFRRSWTRAEWMPDGWEWIEPFKEVQAAAEAVKHGFTTHRAVLGKQGIDYRDTYQQAAKEKEEQEALGLSFGDQPANTDDTADGGNEEEKDDA
jgi:lambda family phage portal protein